MKNWQILHNVVGWNALLCNQDCTTTDLGVETTQLLSRGIEHGLVCLTASDLPLYNNSQFVG